MTQTTADEARARMHVEGVKHDAGKTRIELFPPEALEEISKVLTLAAATKYADHNWRKGMLWSKVYGAAQRHLNAWIAGDSIDPEWGLSHLAHAGCDIAFLIAYEKSGIGGDDRWRPAEIVERRSSSSKLR